MTLGKLRRANQVLLVRPPSHPLSPEKGSRATNLRKEGSKTDHEAMWR